MVAAPAGPTVGGEGRGGDPDLAVVGSLLAEPARCRILLALDDGRALPAGRLASEAGVAPSTASSHLGRLVEGGLLAVEQHGRFRYYRLAGPEVGQLIEAVGALAPASPVRSLREGSRTESLRRARTCYDHVAGALGVALMARFLDRGLLRGGDGTYDRGRAVHDRLSARGRDLDYTLTDDGWVFLGELGVVLPSRGRLVGYCVEWTEQRHHLAGALGAGILARLTALDWVRRSRGSRALTVTAAGRTGLADCLGLSVR